MEMEIGSEYWLDKKPVNWADFHVPDELCFGEDNKLVFLGRTAIDFALEDALKIKEIKTVYFPSYCCSSMLEPFLNRNISVVFYEVSFNKSLVYHIDIDTECDLFFATNYFGYQLNSMDLYIKAFKQKGCIIIEDITHSLLCKKPYYKESDYLVASLRKWFPILSGGLACKIRGSFYEQAIIAPDENLINIKLNAMINKGEFIKNKCNKLRNKYTEEFKIFNNKINNSFSNKDIDIISGDILNNIEFVQVQKKRRENSKILIDKIKSNRNIKFLSELVEGDCPLYVPVIAEESIRNNLRQVLIDNKIYCPVHWPRPNDSCHSNIYNREISLVCDQRYNEYDMHRIAIIINENV